MIPIILSGGSGTRLWPLSRSTHPKQFLNLLNEKSLFQATCLRLPNNEQLKPIIVCNNEHRFLAAHQLQDLGVDAEAIILEPIGRNTAPAIAMAALYLEAQNRDEIMLVLPADHLIEDNETFHNALRLGEEKAQEGKIVTFGIIPNHPETGFGYIQAGNKSNEGSSIIGFKEKPDEVTAQNYINSGDYYWNSGMFMFSSKIFLKELKKFAPDILKTCIASFDNIVSDLDFLRLDAETFSRCRSESIDYAIMEKTDHAYVIPLDAGWSDLGSWTSLIQAKEQYEKKNQIEEHIVEIDCKNSYFYSDNKLITALGVEDIIVIDTLDALLITSKHKVQEVKKVVEELKTLDRSEATIHRLVHRPWGTYDSVDIGEKHQVKRIKVYPGQKLSLQKHFKRAEHWIVVKGIAKVTKDENVYLVKENESTYIPVGSVHSLENPKDSILELIEVQTGDYFGEDDIERLDDIYGRLSK